MKIPLKAARAMRDKSQVDMAKALGIERTYYGKLEKTPERFSIEQVRIICATLEVQPEDIIGLALHSNTQ